MSLASLIEVWIVKEEEGVSGEGRMIPDLPSRSRSTFSRSP